MFYRSKHFTKKGVSNDFLLNGHCKTKQFFQCKHYQIIKVQTTLYSNWGHPIHLLTLNFWAKVFIMVLILVGTLVTGTLM